MADFTDELNQIGFLLGRAYYSYIGLLERRLDERGLGHCLKPGMGSVLFALFRQDDRRLGDLAEELQLAKSTMTRMVARMQKTGLVVQYRDSGDLRAVRLRLMPLAKSLEARSRRLAEEIEQLLCRDLSPSRQRELRRGLSGITRTIAGELQAKPTLRSPKGRKAGAAVRKALTR